MLIAAFSHRSVEVKDGIVLATGLTVHRNSAHQAGVGTIFDRVLTELVAKMREMKMDKTELGCLRSVILFNPGTIFIQLAFTDDSVKTFLLRDFYRICVCNCSFQGLAMSCVETIPIF